MVSVRFCSKTLLLIAGCFSEEKARSPRWQYLGQFNGRPLKLSFSNLVIISKPNKLNPIRQGHRTYIHTHIKFPLMIMIIFWLYLSSLVECAHTRSCLYSSSITQSANHRHIFETDLFNSPSGNYLAHSVSALILRLFLGLFMLSTRMTLRLKIVILLMFCTQALGTERRRRRDSINHIGWDFKPCAFNRIDKIPRRWIFSIIHMLKQQSNKRYTQLRYSANKCFCVILIDFGSDDILKSIE